MASDSPKKSMKYETLFANCDLVPGNTQTKQLLDEVLEEIGYKPNLKSRQGIWSLLISLYEAQETIGDRDYVFVAIPAGDDYWGPDEPVTRQTVRTLRDKLKDAGYLKTKLRSFYGSHFYYRVRCELLEVNLPMFDRYLVEASVESRVVASSAKTKTADGRSRKSIPKSSKEYKDLARLNKIIGSGNVKFSSRMSVKEVSRSFSDFKTKRGGRFYGVYSHKPKQSRLQNMSIDGSSICEVDISACSLTILSSMKHFPLPEGDPYAGITGSKRDIIKALVVRMFGSGDAFNDLLSTDQISELRMRGIEVQRQQKELGNRIRDMYPVLELLEPKKLDSETIAYHESEIVVSAILALHEQHGAVGLPMHDGLIVRKSAATKAQKTLEEAFDSYCQQNKWSNTNRLRSTIEC